jgi:DNA polymerase III epsilon subunit-like protein
MGIKYYIVDVETNGIKAGYHEINEISIIRCDDKVQLTEFIKCEYPERSSLDALAITKKSLSDLNNGNDKNFVVEKIVRFLSEDNLTAAHRCFVGHNVSFDRRFIHNLFGSVDKKCEVDLWLDTLSLSKEFIKISDTSKLNISKTATGRIAKTLQACCDMVGIKKIAGAHASKVDTQNTYFLWKKLIEEKGIDHLPHHKTFVHSIKKDDRLDADDLDLSEVF